MNIEKTFQKQATNYVTILMIEKYILVWYRVTNTHTSWGGGGGGLHQNKKNQPFTKEMNA